MERYDILLSRFLSLGSLCLFPGRGGGRCGAGMESNNHDRYTAIS